MIVIIWGLLLILAIVSVGIAYNLMREEKLNDEREEKQKNKLVQLESELDKKEVLLHQLTTESADKEKKLNAQILELKNSLFGNQDILKKESVNKSNLEKKLQELETQAAKLEKDLSAKSQMVEALISDLKNQLQQSQELLKKEGLNKVALEKKISELQSQLGKLQQESADKDTALKAEQTAHQELKGKYESLFPAKRDPATS